MLITRIAALSVLGCGAVLASSSTLPTTADAAPTAPRVTYTLRVCASGQTPTQASIRYGVGVGESVAASGNATQWLGSGCWSRSVAARSYDRASVSATAAKPNAYIGCAVWANGRRIAKHYAYGRCSTTGHV
ncbi:MAG: hypothetical protein QM728_06395 [Gordonia sp. (in: high G+C Gram-positive bacteria)]|uniref:hypothetical protein n=1 Tax=Gordonia sp. (in: high G+C Gram-positive bacteria) TaxID=84139 RepID=UPI0039E3A320